MACRFTLWALSALFVLSCSQESPSPTAPPAAISAGEAGPWQTVEINGALYRRVAAKPTETSQADLLITIPIRITTEGDGSFRFADTVVIAGRTYTADCGTPSGQDDPTDDVGNTQATATRLTVPSAGTTEYELWFSPDFSLTPGDVDYFVFSVTQRIWFGVASGGSTDVSGTLYNNNGLALDVQDNNRDDGRNFLLLTLAEPGTYYVKVTGATASTSGSYWLSVATRYPDGAGKTVAIDELERLETALLDAKSVNP